MLFENREVGDRLEHRLKQRLMREPWHPSTLSSKLGKAEILARSIIKNGPITNSKRRATDIEKGPVFAKPLLSELGSNPL